MAKRRATRFSDIGGDAALDLLNTRPVGVDGLVERLATADDLVDWCVQFGVLSAAAGSRASERNSNALRTVRGLRETLRTALERPRSARHKQALVKQINAALANAPRFAQLTPDGRSLTYMVETAGIGAIPSLVAERIARFVAGPHFHLARSCAAGDCVLWFMDHTRNHSRQWCRMDGCGARAKARAYYRRKKAKKARR